MQFFKYVPPRDPIGLDLQQTLGFSRAWLSRAGSPYVETNIYPPLTALLFAPLVALDFPIGYRLFTVLNILAYLILTFYLPLGMNRTRPVLPTFILIVATGLISYGFQFELERGQFNVLAGLLCIGAIWIYHNHPRYRGVSYVLFVLSVQLKLYPFIFIVMFIDDWRDRWRNARRMGLLIVANLCALFVLGPGVFADFVRHLTVRQADVVSSTNHAIQSFTNLTLQYLSRHGGAWLNAYAALLQFALLLVVVGCLVAIVIQSARQGTSGVNAFLLLACTLGALVIPATSHDYTLSVLAAPMATLFLSDAMRSCLAAPALRIFHGAAVATLSFAYASTLFSFTNKPHFLSNNFPALLLMLLAVTALCLLRRNPYRTGQSVTSTVGGVRP